MLLRIMSESKKFAFDVGITLIAQAINMFLAFVISVVLGRYLGAEDLGLYRMISSVYAIAVLLASLGIPSAIIKYVAEYKKDQERLDEVVSSGVITSLLLGAAAIPIIFLFSWPLAGFFHMPGLVGLFQILALIFPFTLLSQALLGVMNGLREMKWYSVYYIVQGSIMAGTTAILIYLGWGVKGAVVGLVLSSIASCLLLLLVSGRYFRISLKGFPQITKTLLSFSAPILVTNGINLVNTQADTLLTGYFLNAVEVGYYSASINLSRLLWIMPQAVQMITYPSTAEYYSKNHHAALQMMVDKSTKYTACVLSLSGLTFAFFASDIVRLIYGSKFGSSMLPLQILLIGTVMWGVVMAIGGSVTGAGRPDLGMKLVAISAVTNLGLNFLLIPRVGISGAAVATTTSLMVATCVGIYLTVKILEVRIDYQWFGRMALLIALSALSFYLLRPWSSYLAGATILGIYSIILILFLLQDEDRTLILNLLKNATHLR